MSGDGDNSGLDEIIIKLFDVEALKFGSYPLKSGILSPVYFDLRVIVSYPDLMREVCECIWRALEKASCQCSCVCGVPYTALPLATCLSLDHKMPMVIRRKEAKNYGTKKLIEGHFRVGDTCLIVEDVVTSGSSVLETVEVLNDVGLKVKDAIVLLDRQQGGKQRLLEKGVTLHSVIEMGYLLDVLERAGKVDPNKKQQVLDFLKSNQFKPLVEVASEKIAKKQVLSYAARAAQCTNALSRRLFSIMESKKTNLAFSADVTSCSRLLQLAEQVGPHICVLKTHVDILEDFDASFPQRLRELAAKHDFLIFEDRKFADIGNTVKHQYQGGLYRISEWADIINAHLLPGPGIIQGLKEVGKVEGRGCLLIAEMSSEGNMCTESYTKEAVQQAESEADFVMGFICRNKLSDNPNLVHMTPGVQLSAGSDKLGQCYLTPEEVIARRRSDVVIVGRGILQAPDPQATAQAYREAGYAAFQQLLNA